MSIINQSVSTRQTLLESLLTGSKLLDIAQGGGRDLVTNAPAIDAALDQLAQALENAGVQEPLPEGTAKVTDASAVTVTDTGGKTAAAKVNVTGTSLGGVTLSADTDALASDTQAVSIQDRNGVTLLGSGVAARVSAGKLVSAYFTALTSGVQTDGNPVNVTTARAGSTVAGRIRMYIANNQIVNAYLDGYAMLATGNTVPVQNSVGQNIAASAVTVTSNVVTAVKLPDNYTGVANGRAHPVTDAAGNTASANAVVTAGVMTDNTLVSTAALTLDKSAVTIDGKVYTFTVTAGAITAIAVTDAPAS